MANDEDAYTWETEYERTWEALKEDEAGSLQAAVDDVIHRAKRRCLLQRQPNTRLGMMRHLFLVLDMSKAMEDQDLRPTRLLSSLKLLEHFIEEYFDQNPISQLGIITTSNKRAEIVTQLGGNMKKHIKALEDLKKSSCQGEPSLQNSIDTGLQTLKHMPGHTSREILIILGSLTSCDPADITTTIKAAQSFNIQCSVIGLAAEVQICKKLCRDTHGKYNVILDEPHFKELLLLHVVPPGATSSTESSLIKMGFPAHEQTDQPSMCMCHLDSKVSQGFSMDGYFCPQCRSKYCDLPVECKTCGLTLVSAPHLARSYHHLFPLDLFREVIVQDAIMRSDLRYCYACQSEFDDPQAYQCNKCRQIFCVDCDVYIHESLHSCPGCASSRAASFT